MNIKKYKVYTILALGILIGVVGYWTIDFSDDRAQFNSVLKIMGPGAFFGAMVSTLIRKKKPVLNALTISAGVSMGMLSRILWDMSQNYSSDLVFPFELLIGLAIVIPAAFLGALLIYGIYLVGGK